jgi:hypothetical protein
MGGNTAGLAIDLCKQAEGLAVGNIAKQRCRENINGLQDWINDKPRREKEERVSGDMKWLNFLINKYSHICNSITKSSDELSMLMEIMSIDNNVYNSKIKDSYDLLIDAMPYLTNIKNTLGSSDDLYIELSSIVASIAQGIYIAELNKLYSLLKVYTKSNERFSFLDRYKGNRNFVILQLQICLEETKKSMLLIDKMDLDPSFHARYLKNKQNIIGDGGNKYSGSGGCLVKIILVILASLFLLGLIKAFATQSPQNNTPVLQLKHSNTIPQLEPTDNNFREAVLLNNKKKR